MKMKRNLTEIDGLLILISRFHGKRKRKRKKMINYSLKYARMYGGDLQGIKEKIPYMKELGINAVWLNPVFFSYQNHKYGAMISGIFPRILEQ